MRGDLVGRRTREPIAFVVCEQTPPLTSQPRHQCGHSSGLGLLPPNDSTICAEFPRGGQLGPAPPTRVRAPPRLVRRAAEGQGLLRVQSVTMPIGAGRDVVDPGQMNTKAGEPLPALVTQDPAVRAIDQPPQAMATGLPHHPQIPPGRQPQTLLQPIGVQPTQRAIDSAAVTAKSGTPGHDATLAPRHPHPTASVTTAEAAPHHR